MKKLILSLVAVVAMAGAAHAQKINAEALQAKVEKSQLAAEDAKKGTKAATWIALGKAYADALTMPTKDLYTEMLGMELRMKAGNPKSIDEKIIDGVAVAALNYDYFTAYELNGQIVAWEVTNEVVEDAAVKSLAALQKAYEIDPGQASKIKDVLIQVGNYYLALGDAANIIGQYTVSTNAYEMAYAAELNPAFGGSNPQRLYYAGLTATMAGAADQAMYVRGVEMLNKALEAGYEDEAGQIYYYLCHSYYGQREADHNNVLKAKEALLEGITKFPKNEDILKMLIHLYSTEEGMGDPQELIALVDDSIAKDPQNIDLLFGRAQIFISLNNYEEAIASLEKAIALEPNSYEAQFFTGYYTIRKGDALNNAMNEKDYTNREEMDADQKAVLATYAAAVPYLERAHEIQPQNPDPVQLLKSLCFRLREDPEMMAKYEKYNALYQQFQ